MQQADPASKNLIQLIEDGEKLTVHETRAVENYEVSNGLLYQNFGGKPLLVVSKSMRKGIVIAAHDYGENCLADRTMAKITADY